MPEKIIIAVFIRGFHNGGIEKVFENYYSHMDLSSFEIHMITHMENDPKRKKVFTDLGCIVHELSPVHGHKLTPKNLREYRKLFRDNDFDIVHNNMPDILLPFLLAAKHGRHRPYCILHAHSKYSDGYRRAGWTKKQLYKAGFVWNAKKADLLLAISGESARSAFYSEADRAVILPNAIDIDRFTFRSEIRERVRKELDADGKFILGHIGRIESGIKNHRLLMDLMSALKEKREEVYRDTLLLLIGEGKKSEEYRDYAVQRGIADHIRFLGALDNVQDYLMGMDLFLFPSKQEGLGIAAIEAQTTGLPCLISDRVPREVRLTDNVVFLGIDSEKDTDEWIRQICMRRETVKNRACEADRKAYANVVAEKGYDISEQAQKLSRIYMERNAI